jgi:hypothetical protein
VNAVAVAAKRNDGESLKQFLRRFEKELEKVFSSTNKKGSKS